MAHVGQDMHKHAPVVGSANGICCPHIFSVAVLQVFTAHQSVSARPTRDSQNEHHGHGALGIQNSRNGQDQQYSWYGMKNVVKPIAQIIDNAAVPARDGTQNRAQKSGHESGCQAYQDAGFSTFNGLG